MLWQALIHVDRRSKTSLGKQIAFAIIQAIKQHILQAKDLLPSPKILGDHLKVPSTEVEKAFQILLDQQYLNFDGNQYVIKPITFPSYALPRPFARIKVEENKILPLTTTLIEEKIIKPSEEQINQFPSIKNALLKFVVKHYTTEGRCVATRVTHYVLPNGQVLEELELENRILSTDIYIRKVDIVQPNVQQKKVFTSEATMLLKGFYYFQRGEHEILEFAEVHTTLIYAYEFILSNKLNDFIF
jgi:hypothetical protein